MEGKRPDGGGEQKPLSKQALANPDRESPHRGYHTGLLADGLYRTAIKSDGNTASSTINAPPERNAYLGKERKRGVVLLTAAGAAGEAAATAARETARVMASGAKIVTDPATVAAKDAEQCPDCEGWGDVLTGAKVERGKTIPCIKCGGKGYIAKTYLVAAPAPPTVPYPGAEHEVVNAPPGGNPDGWGRPAGHRHWGIDPAILQ